MRLFFVIFHPTQTRCWPSIFFPSFNQSGNAVRTVLLLQNLLIILNRFKVIFGFPKHVEWINVQINTASDLESSSHALWSSPILSTLFAFETNRKPRLPNCDLLLFLFVRLYFVRKMPKCKYFFTIITLFHQKMESNFFEKDCKEC